MIDEAKLQQIIEEVRRDLLPPPRRLSGPERWFLGGIILSWVLALTSLVLAAWSLWAGMK
jgi:hypothetical protein